MAKPTASESGKNMALAAPTMNSVGLNIARIHNIASSAGTVVSVVASSAARPTERPRIKCV